MVDYLDTLPLSLSAEPRVEEEGPVIIRPEKKQDTSPALIPRHWSDTDRVEDKNSFSAGAGSDKLLQSSSSIWGKNTVLAFALYTHPPTTTLTFLSCFSAPCGQIWASEDIFFIVLNLRNLNLRSSLSQIWTVELFQSLSSQS